MQMSASYYSSDELDRATHNEDLFKGEDIEVNSYCYQDINEVIMSLCASRPQAYIEIGGEQLDIMHSRAVSDPTYSILILYPAVPSDSWHFQPRHLQITAR
ncbi:hypothetical protein ACFE04_028211 [Oxalis oulophora]